MTASQVPPLTHILDELIDGQFLSTQSSQSSFIFFANIFYFNFQKLFFYFFGSSVSFSQSLNLILTNS